MSRHRASRPMDDEERAERIKKLPRWAQDHIELLSRRVDEARGELRRYFDPLDEDDQTPYWSSYSNSNRGLPKEFALPGGRARFNLGRDQYGRAHQITVSLAMSQVGTPCVEVRASHSGLRIIPQVSNCVSITTRSTSDKEKS